LQQSTDSFNSKQTDTLPTTTHYFLSVYFHSIVMEETTTTTTTTTTTDSSSPSDSSSSIIDESVPEIPTNETKVTGKEKETEKVKFTVTFKKQVFPIEYGLDQTVGELRREIAL
jgi:hypothetical protein